MRLIDADALQFMVHYQGTFAKGKNPVLDALVAVQRFIDNAPTIDAVPVVRCKDCESFGEYTETYKAAVGKADGACFIRCMVAPDDPKFCNVQKDDYCSMGKRKGAKMDGGAQDDPT